MRKILVIGATGSDVASLVQLLSTRKNREIPAEIIHVHESKAFADSGELIGEALKISDVLIIEQAAKNSFIEMPDFSKPEVPKHYKTNRRKF